MSRGAFVVLFCIIAALFLFEVALLKFDLLNSTLPFSLSTPSIASIALPTTNTAYLENSKAVVKGRACTTSNIAFFLTNQGLFSQLHQIEGLWNIVRGAKRNISLSVFASHHYSDFSRVNLCEFIQFPSSISCFSLPAGDTDRLFRDSCVMLDNIQSELPKTRKNYLNPANYGFDSSLPVVHSIDACSTKCFAGHVFWKQRHQMDVMPWSLREKYRNLFGLIKASLGIDNTTFYYAVHWRRGDQLATRCAEESLKVGGQDVSVNCKSPENFVQKIHNMSGEIGVGKFAYVSTNEQNSTMIEQALLVGQKLGLKLIFAKAIKEILAESFVRLTSMETLILEYLIMCDAPILLTFGLSEIHSFLDDCRTESALRSKRVHDGVVDAEHRYNKPIGAPTLSPTLPLEIAAIPPPALVLPSLFVLGLSRDTRSHDELALLRRNIDALTSRFQRSEVILYVDAAAEASFRTWNHSNVRFLKEPSPQVSDIRTARIAHGRNACLDEMNRLVKERNEKAEDVYMVAVDMDEISAPPFHMDVFDKVLHERSEWDVVSFNRPGYYDIWGLRYKRIDLNIIEKGFDLNEIRLIRADIVKELENWGTSYYPVISAFNGIAIYKYNYTVGCRYFHEDPRFHFYNQTKGQFKNGNNEDVDHTSIHRCMIDKNNARIMIHTGNLITKFFTIE